MPDSTGESRESVTVSKYPPERTDIALLYRMRLFNRLITWFRQCLGVRKLPCGHAVNNHRYSVRNYGSCQGQCKHMSDGKAHKTFIPSLLISKIEPFLNNDCFFNIPQKSLKLWKAFKTQRLDLRLRHYMQLWYHTFDLGGKGEPEEPESKHFVTQLWWSRVCHLWPVDRLSSRRLVTHPNFRENLPLIG